MRRAALFAAVLGLTPGLTRPAEAQPVNPHTARLRVDMPSMALEDALLRLSADAGVAIAFQSEHVRGRRAPALRGDMSLDDALARALGDAPLAVTLIGQGGYAIAPAPRRRSAAASSGYDFSDEIVVLGSALSRRSALRTKRDATAIVDAQGPDELGQLPDTNAGESVDRLAGVSMLVEKGEGRYVQVRGLDTALNAITLNGAPIGSPEAELGGRLAPLDVFSAQMLRAVVVIKTRGPNMDAQGIGGVIDLQTRSPFDNPLGLHGDATLRAGYEMTRPEPQAYGGDEPYAGGANLSYVSRDGRFGAAFGSAYSSREYVSQGVYQDDWSDRGGFALPENVKNNYYVIGRQRVNASGEAAWRLGADDGFSISGFYSAWDEYQHRLRYEQNLTAGVVADSASAGRSGPNRALAALRYENAEKTIATTSARGRLSHGAWSFDLQASAHRNRLTEPHANWEFRSAPIFGPARWEVEDDVVTISPSPGSPARLDPSLYLLNRLRLFDRALTESAQRVFVSSTFNASTHLAFETGLGVARTVRRLEEGARVFGPGGTAFSLNASPTLLAGGFVNETPRAAAPNFWLNVSGLNAYFNDPAHADQFALRDEVSFDDSFAADYDIDERVLSGYAMARYQTARVELEAGVRWEATDVRSGAYALVDKAARWRTGRGAYQNVLPGVLLAWRPQDDLVVRASVTSALARPGYNLIRPSAGFSEEDDRTTLALGDPDLRARHASSADLSLEWYPNALSLVSVAGYFKEIDGEPFVSTTRLEGAEIGAALDAFGLHPEGAELWTSLDIQQPRASGRSTLLGLEINVQTQFSALPQPFDALGAAASLTLIDGDTEFPTGSAPLQGRPEETVALTLYYQSGPIDASISYSHNGSYLTTLADDPANSLYQGAFGRIDARIAYALSPAAKMFIEGVNLNNEPTTEFQGGVESWNTEYEYVGRTLNAGLAFAF